MTRWITLAALLITVRPVAAEPPRFKFTKGETLAYHLVQTTVINETVLDEKTNKAVSQDTTTKVDLVRKWKVADVDANGVATLEMSIASMKWERTAGKDVDSFDSTKPDDLNKSELAKHVGPVLAVLRIDLRGNLVEVKESKVGPAARFTSDLPFKLVLPEAETKAGTAWDRSYTIQLDPPLGTGEKYASKQAYLAQEPKDGLLPVRLTTEIKDLPEAGERVPLLPMMPEGLVYFQPATGRYYASRLKVAKELKNHQGEGSSYKITSTFVEDLMP